MVPVNLVGWVGWEEWGLGLGFGCSLGEAVGLLVGLGLGVGVGPPLGEAVGLDEGTPVGVCVGGGWIPLDLPGN